MRIVLLNRTDRTHFDGKTLASKARNLLREYTPDEHYRSWTSLPTGELRPETVLDVLLCVMQIKTGEYGVFHPPVLWEGPDDVFALIKLSLPLEHRIADVVISKHQLSLIKQARTAYEASIQHIVNEINRLKNLHRTTLDTLNDALVSCVDNGVQGEMRSGHSVIVLSSYKSYGRMFRDIEALGVDTDKIDYIRPLYAAQYLNVGHTAFRRYHRAQFIANGSKLLLSKWEGTREDLDTIHHVMLANNRPFEIYSVTPSVLDRIEELDAEVRRTLKNADHAETPYREALREHREDLFQNLKGILNPVQTELAL